MRFFTYTNALNPTCDGFANSGDNQTLLAGALRQAFTALKVNH